MPARKAAPKAAKKPLLAFEPADEELDVPDQSQEPEPTSPPTGFVWKPADGSPAIILPVDFPQPGKLWLWERYNESLTVQSFAWMEWAKVPKPVQRRCVSLPDDEYLQMLTAWFKYMGGATPGE